MAKKTVTGVLTELLGMERQVVSRARARSQKRLKVERLRSQLQDTQAMLLLTESVLETLKVRMESFRSSIESETGLTESRHIVELVRCGLDLLHIGAVAAGYFDKPLRAPPREFSGANTQLAGHFLELTPQNREDIAKRLGLLPPDYQSLGRIDLAKQIFGAARQSHRLADLWTAVEQIHPEGRPLPNPYAGEVR